MKVFLDTNVFLDIADEREYSMQGRTIYELSQKGFYEACASYLTFANINYIKRDTPRAERYNLIRNLCKGVTVLPCDAHQLSTALAHDDVRDFEDLLQYQCAVAANCDVIVTNNTRDYREFCQLPLMTSRDFLLHFFRSQ
jgi:predicted nucleic acid-binding protein